MAALSTAVDTDGTGNYTSLNAAEAAQEQDLTDGGGDTFEFTCEASSGSVDTTAVSVDGWTTAPANFILINAADGDEVLKTGWDASRYRLVVAGRSLEISEQYVRITRLQIESNANANYGIFLEFGSNGGEVLVDSCWIRSSHNSGRCLGTIGRSTDFIIQNTIVTTVGSFAVFFDNSSGTNTLYNSIVYGDGAGTGVFIRDASATVKNCAIFNHADDVNKSGTGTATIQYNAADDDLDTEFTESTNVQPSGGDWSNEFATPGSDFTAQTGGNIENNGIGPGSDANVPTTDIDGTARSGATCDIGADEIAGAPAGIVVLRRRRAA